MGFDSIGFGAIPLVQAMAQLADAKLRTLPTDSGNDNLSAQMKRPSLTTPRIRPQYTVQCCMVILNLGRILSQDQLIGLEKSRECERGGKYIGTKGKERKETSKRNKGGREIREKELRAMEREEEERLRDEKERRRR